MVRITPEIIVKYASHTKKRREESDSQYLRRLTHIYFQERSIVEIENLGQCKNLTVLYLYNNKIKEIKNLSFASNLTHLYLQRNEITTISGLNNLTKLNKLYLGQNIISVVEDLHKLPQLKELHIESQLLPDGEQLLFDPRTLEGLSRSLEVLNVSDNNLEELTDLFALEGLTHLIASNNQVSALQDVLDGLMNWSYLSRLELNGNPVTAKPKYRDKAIAASQSLVTLDNKEVPESTRAFLKNWEASKKARRLAKAKTSNVGSYNEFSNNGSCLSFQAESSHTTWQPSQSAHLSKQQRQFEAVLAKANQYVA